MFPSVTIGSFNKVIKILSSKWNFYQFAVIAIL